MQLETILCEFGRICATGNALMQLETILCKFGRIGATGNAFVRPTIGRNSILNFPAKFEKECAEPFCKYSDDSSQCKAKASLEKAPTGLQRPSHMESQ